MSRPKPNAKEIVGILVARDAAASVALDRDQNVGTQSLRVFSVTVPLPPKGCRPNDRCHWRVKAKAVKGYRETVKALALAAHPDRHRWPRATAHAEFVVRQNRRRDGDNLLASLKAAWDGLRDAGVIADDSGLTFAPVSVRVERLQEWPKGCVRITIQKDDHA